MKITIPKPCHENWDTMTPKERGRFCSVCSKTVFDFTDCSDDVILEAFSTAQGTLCGRFRKSQLNRNLIKVSAVVLFTIASQNIGAQQLKHKDSLSVKEIEEVVVVGISIPVDLEDEVGNHTVAPKNSTPIYVLDGKPISYAKYKKLNQKNYDIQILNAEGAMVIYGRKGKSGAVIINSKEEEY